MKDNIEIVIVSLFWENISDIAFCIPRYFLIVFIEWTIKPEVTCRVKYTIYNLKQPQELKSNRTKW